MGRGSLNWGISSIKLTCGYHLQALRHLYVLAAEPRLLVPVDVDTNTPCYALLEVTYKSTQWYEQTKEELMAPALLPELHLLKQIKVKGPRYWELLIDLSKGVQHLKSILSKDGVLYVKLRAGQLSYKEDPMGWQSLLAQTVANRNSEARAFKPETISAFTSDPALLPFAEYFCKPTVNMGQYSVHLLPYVPVAVTVSETTNPSGFLLPMENETWIMSFLDPAQCSLLCVRAKHKIT
ncbi:anaphase-promoting complex subunit 1-like [Nannospalax galili]|uniref:anaphase-promoting complex subunit 1-like n=1 Tax=Nannospalax galili TaxID=1026970 RepID=UPI00111BF058|nr:anaphase-promoting complex subunit 1-like [Nannospalax galili]